MYNNIFVEIGDTVKSSEETKNFHRDQTYNISYVFSDIDKQRIFITDKNGFDIEYRYEFEITPKTLKLSDERQLIFRLNFLWENTETLFSNKITYQNIEYFILQQASYFSSEPEALAKLTKYYDIDMKNIVSETYFKTKSEYYEYFKKQDINNFKVENIKYSIIENIDYTGYLLSLPKYDESVLNLPESNNNDKINSYIHRNPLTLDEFLTLVTTTIFDEPVISDENKAIMVNIIEAFELLPKSYGVTSVAKLIQGKVKKIIASVAHLSKTCTKLKYPQLFELVNFIDSYMYVNKIFITKEEYSSGKEWRGNFEFIGSKMIDTDKLTEIKNKLK